MFIINPLSGRGIDNWFSTHPNTENRIAELEEMAREKGQIAGNGLGRGLHRLSHGLRVPRAASA